MLSASEKRSILTRMWLAGDPARLIGDAINMSQHQVCVVRRQLNLPKRSLEQRLANYPKSPNYIEELEERRLAVLERKKVLAQNRTAKEAEKRRLMNERATALENKRNLFLALVREDTPIRDAALASGIPIKRAIAWMASKQFA